MRKSEPTERLNPLVEKKRPSDGEFFVNLFEHCNLRCAFCWQNHEQWDGIDTIVDRAKDILNRVKVDLRQHFVINLMGGELFSDEVPDTAFVSYLNLLEKLLEGWPSSAKSFEVNWVTNLVYEKTDRVLSLLSDIRRLGIKTRLTTSFDFSGRFNAKSKSLFERNLYLLRSDIGTVSVVLTRPNIEALISKKDELFEKMYADDFSFYFDYYSPEKNYKVMAPSDALLQAGLVYLVENYPKTWPVAGWLDDAPSPMTCMGSMVVDHRGYQGRCRSLLSQDLSKKLNSSFDATTNASMEEAFVEKYNCATCEYYLRCGMGCFLQHDFKGRQEMTECLYKGVFRRIDDLELGQN